MSPNHFAQHGLLLAVLGLALLLLACGPSEPSQTVANNEQEDPFETNNLAAGELSATEQQQYDKLLSTVTDLRASN